MINNTTQVSPSSGLSGTNVQANSTSGSSKADLLASFQSIFASMMTNNMSSSDSQSSSGMGDLMAPLMMVLMEKMIESQMDQTATTNASQTTAGETSTNSNVSLASKAEPSGRPVDGVITQNFHPGHNGLDFGVVVGTSVKATMSGKVIYAGWNDQGYGNLVIVENGAYRTYYAHLSSIPVSVGDQVNSGSVVGLSGNTGNSTGPHLHYEIRKNDVPIDPTTVTLGVSA